MHAYEDDVSEAVHSTWKEAFDGGKGCNQRSQQSDGGLTIWGNMERALGTSKEITEHTSIIPLFISINRSIR